MPLVVPNANVEPLKMWDLVCLSTNMCPRMSQRIPFAFSVGIIQGNMVAYSLVYRGSKDPTYQPSPTDGMGNREWWHGWLFHQKSNRIMKNDYRWRNRQLPPCHWMYVGTNKSCSCMIDTFVRIDLMCALCSVVGWLVGWLYCLSKQLGINDTWICATHREFSAQVLAWCGEWCVAKPCGSLVSQMKSNFMYPWFVSFGWSFCFEMIINIDPEICLCLFAHSEFILRKVSLELGSSNHVRDFRA